MGKYKVIFSTSGPGKMIYIAICNSRGNPLQIGTVLKAPGTPWAYQDKRLTKGSSQTLHGLHNKFLYFCKMLKIDPTPYQVK